MRNSSGAVPFCGYGKPPLYSYIITRGNNSHSRAWLGILGGIIFKNKRNTAPERATEGERITIVSNLGLLVVLAC